MISANYGYSPQAYSYPQVGQGYPTQQAAPAQNLQSLGTAFLALSLLTALQQLQSGFAGFAGAQPQQAFPPQAGFGAQGGGFPTPNFNIGFPSSPLLGFGGGSPAFSAFPAPPATPNFNIGFPSIPQFGLGTPLASGGPSLASQALMLQAAQSDALIAGNIGFQTGAIGSLAGAQSLALAGPFASPFFF